MRKMKNLLLCIAATLLLSSCTSLYKPNMIQSPMLTEKGDFNVSGALGISGMGNGHVQTAYAPVEHLGIMLNMMGHSESPWYSQETQKLQILNGEAGIGIHNKFGSKNNLLLQVYAGYGRGRSVNYIDNNSPESRPEMSSNFSSLFFQPGIAYVGDLMNVAVDFRFKRVTMFDLNARLYREFEWWNTEYEFFNNSSVAFGLFEPVVTFKIGDENYRGIFQAGLNIPIANTDNYYTVNPYEFFGLSFMKVGIGFEYSINTNRKTKANQ